MTRKEKALAIAEYAFGAPLFTVVAAATAVVLAVGFPVVQTVVWLRERR
jgi:hypothetical protein